MQLRLRFAVATEAVTRRLLAPAWDESLAACRALDPGGVDSLNFGGRDAVPALRAGRVETGHHLLKVDLLAAGHQASGYNLEGDLEPARPSLRPAVAPLDPFGLGAHHLATTSGVHGPPSRASKTASSSILLSCMMTRLRFCCGVSFDQPVSFLIVYSTCSSCTSPACGLLLVISRDVVGLIAARAA